MGSSLSPAERHKRAQIAANESWAKTPDRTARTQPARDALARKYEDRVDPDHKLDPAERAKRVESARKADLARISFESLKARRARKAAKKASATTPPARGGVGPDYLSPERQSRGERT